MNKFSYQQFSILELNSTLIGQFLLLIISQKSNNYLSKHFVWSLKENKNLKGEVGIRIVSGMVHAYPMDYDFRSRSGPQVPMYRPPPSPSPYQQNPTPSCNPLSLNDQGFKFSFVFCSFLKFAEMKENLIQMRFYGGEVECSYWIECAAGLGFGVRVAIKPEYRITPPVRFALLVFLWMREFLNYSTF